MGLELILFMRLLCDLAVWKKRKLYVVFTEFSNAYEPVPRDKLLTHTQDGWCVVVTCFKPVKKCSYTCSFSVLYMCGVINAAILAYVKGHPSTTCVLLVLCVDKMIKMFKRVYPCDSFLGDLHALTMIDDTVMLSSSRAVSLSYFFVVLNFCTECGMEIREAETSFSLSLLI